MSGLLADMVAAFIGFSGGLAVGSATVAFLIVLDIIPRLAQLTRSYRKIVWYETAVISGSLYWTLADFFNWELHAQPLGAALTGLLAGVFVGMLAAALTEVLNFLPILAKRLRLSGMLVWLLMAMVLGKVAGSLLDWLLHL